jgi:hypothetical protein
MTASLKKAALAVAAAAGVGLTGCGTTMAAAHTTAAHGSQTISAVIHRTNLVFVTPSGSSTPYPTGPVVPGDRVLGRDDLLQHGSTIGSDFEVCTASFGLHVLCDDMVDITNVGELHVTWMFQWPSSGTSGPSVWDGVVDGGTGNYANASGDFHARALPSGDDSITLRIVQPS